MGARCSALGAQIALERWSAPLASQAGPFTKCGARCPSERRCGRATGRGRGAELPDPHRNGSVVLGQSGGLPWPLAAPVSSASANGCLGSARVQYRAGLLHLFYSGAADTDAALGAPAIGSATASADQPDGPFAPDGLDDRHALSSGVGADGPVGGGLRRATERGRRGSSSSLRASAAPEAGAAAGLSEGFALFEALPPRVLRPSTPSRSPCGDTPRSRPPSTDGRRAGQFLWLRAAGCYFSTRCTGPTPPPHPRWAFASSARARRPVARRGCTFRCWPARWCPRVGTRRGRGPWRCRSHTTRRWASMAGGNWEG